MLPQTHLRDDRLPARLLVTFACIAAITLAGCDDPGSGEAEPEPSQSQSSPADAVGATERADRKPGEQGSAAPARTAPIARATAAATDRPLRFGGRFEQPQPAPDLPEAFDPYVPPTPSDAASTRFSAWTRTAGADEHVLLAGHDDPGDNRAMRFEVFGQTEAQRYDGQATIAHRREHQAMVRLPADAPPHSMYLIFPRIGDQRGQPAAINRAELWYVLPREASPGEVCAAFGRNLSHDHGEQLGWVYLKPRDANELGIWAKVTAANPYRVEFELPDNLPHGQYEVWAHNGHGGRYGWAALHQQRGGSITPAHLTVGPPHRWTGPTFDVTDFGADGADDADDSAAILEALHKANAAKNATVHFPAGTYYVSKTIGPVKGADESGIRLRGEGMDETYIKGKPGSPPKLMMHIAGGNVELRDLVLDINELGEEKKYYRGADRGEHNPAHYAYLEKVDAARDAIKKWKNKHKGQPVPEAMKPPESPGFPDVEARRKRVAPASKRGGGRFIKKDVWAGGLTIVNCVLDAERRNIELLKGVSDTLIENCDVVAREVKLGAPQFTRIRDCNFYARADTGVILYVYGGWCNSVTHNTARDYMPNTYDTGMGRWYTGTLYGNRQENIYIAHNRTHDLTVNPVHYNQNAGEQIMWEDMPITSTQKPVEVGPRTLRFAKPIKGKLKWYSDAIVVEGRGMGQYRRVADYDKQTHTLTLVRDWDVPPNTDSVIQIGRPIRRVVVYDNHLDAKPRAYQSESHIASSGVQPFGASIDLIVERNTFHELRTGIATFSPYMWHRYARNSFDTNRTGVRIGEGTGAVIRHNTMNGIVQTGYQTTSGKKWPSWKLEAFEHNRGANVPLVVRLGNRYNQDVDNARVIVYGNRFNRGESGDGPSRAIRAAEPADLIQNDNTWTGYEKTIAPQ